MKKYIELLEKNGIMSSSLIQRKFKCSSKEAIDILKDMVADYENVTFWKNDKIIVIEGCEPKIKEHIKKAKQKKVKIRKSRWKDITKI